MLELITVRNEQQNFHTTSQGNHSSSSKTTVEEYHSNNTINFSAITHYRSTLK
jgi:hypothetical protein